MVAALYSMEEKRPFLINSIASRAWIRISIRMEESGSDVRSSTSCSLIVPLWAWGTEGIQSPGEEDPPIRRYV